MTEFYILDTDTVSLMLVGNEAVWKRRLEDELHLIAVSIITVEEQINGWYGLLRRPTSPKVLAQIYEKMTRSIILLAGLPIVTFSEAAIYRFESLRTLRLNVGSNDLRIAAIALETTPRSSPETFVISGECQDS